jgi:predicted small lipoprotein YifL
MMVKKRLKLVVAFAILSSSLVGCGGAATPYSEMTPEQKRTSDLRDEQDAAEDRVPY